MTQHELVPLRCPSCGRGITQPSREMAFGAAFRCDHCNTTSVLIVDQALVPLSSLQKVGEKVCTACGRVSQREARFCQEGHALVRRCVKCLQEFTIDHQRCDFCGWVQTVNPAAKEGQEIAFDRAVKDLADPSASVVIDALVIIANCASTVSGTAITLAVSAIQSLMMHPLFRASDITHIIETKGWFALGSLGPAAVPAIQKLLKDSTFGKSSKTDEGVSITDLGCWAALSRIGCPAEQVAPLLVTSTKEIWPQRWAPYGRWRLLFQTLTSVSPKDALAVCSRSLEEGEKDDLKHDDAVKAAFRIGKPAIPILERFCGPFSGRRGRSCKAAVAALRAGASTFSITC